MNRKVDPLELPHSASEGRFEASQVSRAMYSRDREIARLRGRLRDAVKRVAELTAENIRLKERKSY